MIRFVYVFVVLLFIFLGKGYSQDSLQQKHMEIMSDINCDLSNSWAINLNLNDSTEDGYEACAIKSFLFTYKTKKDGRNSGVILNLYSILHKDIVLKKKDAKYASVCVEFLYTDNYIVYINYGNGVDEKYDEYVFLLMDELRLFFEVNKSEL